MAYFLSFIFSLLSLSLFAKELGIYGQTFEVEEENLICYMQKRSENVSMDHLKSIFKTLRPQFVSIELREAVVYNQFYFDPTVCTKENILDHHGNIIIFAETCQNPLDYTSLAAPLLFLDGNSEEHLAWARNQQTDAKWILVKGNPLDLEQKEKRPIFFDQQRTLVQKLSLTCIPVKVSQEGKFLRIEECPIREIR